MKNYLIYDIIDKKMENKEAFTAFDITMAARKKGCLCRHNDIKSYIHEAIRNNYKYEEFEYDRELINIPGINRKAFLYRPEGYDINNYITMDRDELYEPVDNPKFEPVDKEDWLLEEEDNYVFYDDDDNDLF